jgi:hypothetical protein
MMANRRELLIGIGASVLAVSTGRFARAAAPGSWVLYVSAADCRICRAWEVDHKDAFARGLQKNGIGFRTVTVSSLRDVREDAAWPANLKWVRDSYPNMKGTPWFFVISGRSIEMAANSTDMWRTKLLPLAA